MSLELVRPEDLDTEIGVQKQPYSLEKWLEYIGRKKERSNAEQIQLYRRALSRLPNSFKLWTGYIDLCESIAHPGDTKELVQIYETYVANLGEFVGAWTRFLGFLVKNINFLDITYIRLQFNTALRSLSVVQNFPIWRLFIEFADLVGGLTSFSIYKRYFILRAKLDSYPDLFADLPSLDETVQNLIQTTESDTEFRQVQAVIEQIIANDQLILQLSISELELCEKYWDLVLEYESDDHVVQKTYQHLTDKFPDQRVQFLTRLVDYYETQEKYIALEDLLETEIAATTRLQDFVDIYNEYLDVEERRIDLLAENIDQHSAELEVQIARFEKLVARRPLLASDTLLRHNPNDVAEWQHRISLYTDKNEQADCFARAMDTINPEKIELSGVFSKFWIEYSQFYASNGNIPIARKILQTATKVPFRHIDDLVEIWLYWAEWELDTDYHQAVRVMQTALERPKFDGKISYLDTALSAQTRVHKSLKLWEFYLDLVESSDDTEQVCTAYNKMIDLKVATVQTFLNYANYLEEKSLMEKSFQVYERGVLLFQYPVVFEIWSVYLTKALEYHEKLGMGLERIRDLFEDSLKGCPPDQAEWIFNQYGGFEETKGSKLVALKIYQRAIDYIPAYTKKLELYQTLIPKVFKFKSPESARAVYQHGLETVSVNTPGFLNILVQGFVNLELQLGQIKRCREIYKYAAELVFKFGKREKDLDEVWNAWKQFEVDNGTEESYKQLLRFKRHLENTSVNVRQKSQESLDFVKGETRGTMVSATVNDAEIDLDLDDIDGGGDGQTPVAIINGVEECDESSHFITDIDAQVRNICHDERFVGRRQSQVIASGQRLATELVKGKHGNMSWRTNGDNQISSPDFQRDVLLLWMALGEKLVPAFNVLLLLFAGYFRVEPDSWLWRSSGALFEVANKIKPWSDRKTRFSSRLRSIASATSVTWNSSKHKTVDCCANSHANNGITSSSWWPPC
ncbi:hypothetical protein OGAPHI_001883 [Ogataea philodendri]|uniref:Pre-mRNA-splicing factor SYF1 n=1 Tax=Ogataea philodendri TaxID=1378263 RepID=A0A9P8PBB7_9ASCO|nr:uncharacterized protein OGAPHI_001883 [Ogataea philodendri]KAH3668129.1 hypothetical protein OGAPHI_001883 [Ogataea philodendri]